MKNLIQKFRNKKIKNLIPKFRIEKIKNLIKKIRLKKRQCKLKQLIKERDEIKDVIKRLTDKNMRLYDSLEGMYPNYSEDEDAIQKIRFKKEIARTELAIETFKEDLMLTEEEIKKLEKYV